MALRTARQAYNDLAKYFGLREKDAFLSKISEPTTTSGGKPVKETSKDKFYNEIFGDGQEFKSDSELNKLLANYVDVEKDVCVTPSKEVADTPGSVLNTQKSDQGWGKPAADHYSIHGDVLPAGTPAKGSTTVYQVFPAARGTDIIDTEIITLFLSNLSSLEMSRAVPYIDIAISTAVGEDGVDKKGNFVADGDTHFSLGRFLGAGENEKALRGKFLGETGTAATFASDKKANLQTVASMEIFTTPQTLVNAKNVQYNEALGGPIDAFRPFMNLEGLEISIVPTAYGTIAYKTASMTIKLFDRGRLRDIAPLVSPQRKGNVQFYITYGWSHPDGTTVSRPGDVAGSRMGDLINAMKLSEAYIVTNSSFSFGGDGVVSITVELAMVGADSASAADVLQTSEDVGMDELMTLMNGIQKKMNAIRKVMPSSDIPQLIAGFGPENVLQMDGKDQKKIRAIANTLRNGSNASLKDLSKDLSSLVGARNNVKGSLGKAQKSIDEKIKKHIDYLASTPDPFLRPNNRGVTEKQLQGSHRSRLKAGQKPSAKNRQRFVSFGKLMTYFLTQVFQSPGTDLQFVFTPFNYSAGAMYDYNIAQFPIKLDSLKTHLSAEVKKQRKISAMALMQFVEQYFFSFQAASAYGLDLIYTPDERDNDTHKAKLQNSIKKEIEKDGGRLTFNNMLQKNLTQIYGKKRIRPTFVSPQVTMNITTRKSQQDPAKNITRVTFFDAVAGQVMPVIDAFNSAARSGHFVKESLNGDPKNRGARHDETASATYKTLNERKLISTLAHHLTQQQGGAGSIDALVAKITENVSAFNKKPEPGLKERLESTLVFNFDKAKGKQGSLKTLFFEFAPSLIYGTVASGILSADLSSQQNDALTSIALVAALTGKDGKPVKEDMSLPLMVHPTTLKLTTFGCPFFRYSQKFFVDLGTNTSADNFYAVIGVSHSIKQGEFTTSIDMIQTDAYGSFVHADSEIEKTMISVELASSVMK